MVEDWSTTSDSVSPKDPAGLTRTWLKMSGYADTGREASRSDFFGECALLGPKQGWKRGKPYHKSGKIMDMTFQTWYCVDLYRGL